MTELVVSAKRETERGRYCLVRDGDPSGLDYIQQKSLWSLDDCSSGVFSWGGGSV